MDIRPTALGWKGFALLAALLLAYHAAAYSNLFFLLIAFGGVLGGLAAALGVANVRAVAEVRVAAPAAAAGARRTATLRVVARRAAHDVALVVTLPGGAATLARLDAPAGASEHAAEAPGQPRGIAAVATAVACSSWPFGLFTCRRSLPIALELVTYPAPTTAALALAAMTAGRDGREPAIAGVRPFRPGDAVADVDWKATARRGEPMTKEREQPTHPQAVVVVDRRLAGPALEAALAGATAAVLAQAQRGLPLRLRSQGADLVLAPGRDGAAPLLRWLAAAGRLPADAPPPEAGR